MRISHNDIEIRSRLWIELNGDPVFGRGRRSLLEAIDKYGSINQAARDINISYRRAWSYTVAREERLSINLVERQARGRNGGGTTLTDEARTFINKHKLLEEEIQEIVDVRFNTIFG